MRGCKLRTLRTDGASKSRMMKPSFFLNYPSKNQKNPLASTPTAIAAVLFPAGVKKEVPFPETLTRSVTRLPGRNFFYFFIFYPSFKGFTLTPGPIVEVIVTLFI